MKKGVFLIVAFVFIAIFAMQITFADFKYGTGSDIENTYVGGELISGKINISIDSESANSVFTSTFDGSIKLIDFLNTNSLVEGADYNCSFDGCIDRYIASGSNISTIHVSDSLEKVVGFRITGSSVSVNSVRFAMTGNAAPSCSDNFRILVLDNENNSVQNYAYVNQVCGETIRGCYDRSLNSPEWAEIGTEAYCEKVELPAAPAFKVGARVKDRTQGTDNLRIEMFDSDWNSKGKCLLPKNTQQIDEPQCIIESPNSGDSEHFICISADSGAANYNINIEDSGDICGNSGTNFDEFVIDYDLFAQPLRFGTVNIELNESTYQKIYGDSLAGIIDTYLDEKYGRNCLDSLGGCVIPMRFLSGNAQTISLSKIEIKYNRLGANNNIRNDMYSLEKANSTITSKYLILDLEKAGLSIPVTTSKKTLQFYLNGKSILPKAININVTPGFNYELNPKTVLVGIDTLLSISTSENITSVSWKFGDGQIATSQGKSISHRYSDEGEYFVEVAVTSRSGVTVKKTFSLIVGDPQTAAGILISKYDSNIANLSAQIKSYPLWIASQLDTKINLSEINITLKAIKEGPYALQNYAEAVDQLVLLDIPKNIIVKGSGNLPLEIGFNEIDPSYLEVLSERTLSQSNTQRELIRQKLVNWNIENYNSKVEYKNIFIQKDSLETVPIFTHFKIILNYEGSGQKPADLVIAYPKELLFFAQDYGQIEIATDYGIATAIPISGSGSFEFLAPEEFQVSELGAYVAPEISELGLIEGPVDKVPDNTRPKTAKWLYLLIIFLFFATYIALQEWYKRRYESYLFKDKKDLYNLLNFIFNSRVSRLSDGEIRKKLASYNWKTEQLNYAFRKLDGRRTGMWEIPIFKFLENRKVKSEIAKRQEQNTGGERFIKTRY